MISSEPVQTEYLQIRMLDAQKREIEQAAVRRGVTISEFARRALAAAAHSTIDQVAA